MDSVGSVTFWTGRIRKIFPDEDPTQNADPLLGVHPAPNADTTPDADSSPDADLAPDPNYLHELL